jgi:hypothetical protein
MKRSVATIIGIIALVGVLFSQDTPEAAWEKSVVGGLNVTQTAFDNWSAGGENAFAWQVNVSYKLIQDKEKTEWSNTGKFAYGANKTGDAGTQKSVDEIKVESKLVYKLGSKINPYAAFNAETQFTTGYNYATDPATEISNFLDPGYFRESFGAGYDINEKLSTRVGLSLKQTVADAYAAKYSDDPETPEIETLRSEFGMESVSDLSMSFSENAEYTTKLELFSAFGSLDETDINWDNTLTVKISEYFNINVGLKMVYDKDVSDKRQVKQSMALGFNYTFI